MFSRCQLLLTKGAKESYVSLCGVHAFDPGRYFSWAHLRPWGLSPEAKEDLRSSIHALCHVTAYFVATPGVPSDKDMHQGKNQQVQHPSTHPPVKGREPGALQELSSRKYMSHSRFQYLGATPMKIIRWQSIGRKGLGEKEQYRMQR